MKKNVSIKVAWYEVGRYMVQIFVQYPLWQRRFQNQFNVFK